MSIDGSNAQQLTNGAGETAPFWSPDGHWIYYTSVVPFAGMTNIWRIEARAVLRSDYGQILRGFGCLAGRQVDRIDLPRVKRFAGENRYSARSRWCPCQTASNPSANGGCLPSLSVVPRWEIVDLR